MLILIVIIMAFGFFGKSSHTTANGDLVPPIPDPDRRFVMPAEEEPHEGTWLQWPHDYEGRQLVKRYEESWIQMTKALHTGERVHIIVYNGAERERVSNVLEERGVQMSEIDFYEWKTNDVWIRDNGPIFVYDENNVLTVTNWYFNGWGEKYPYEKSNRIPKFVARDLDLPVVSVKMVHEGGSVEVDGNGTLMAKRSSILNKNRNKGWTQEDAEAYFTHYLGVHNFIWLDGQKGLDITDDHIDGTARFAHNNTIVTFYRKDFLVREEYDILTNAVSARGEKYNIVHLPITTRKIVNREYGYYVNYYVGNKVVLVPSFDDPNDDVAAETLQKLYPNRRVVKIPMAKVLKDGGLVHCVTQQQPQPRHHE
jgi:agmatine deiminase